MNKLIHYRQAGGPLPGAVPPGPPVAPPGPPMDPAMGMPPQGMPPQAPMAPPPPPAPMTFAEKVEEARQMIKSGRTALPKSPEVSMTPTGMMDGQGDGPVNLMPGSGELSQEMVGPDQGPDTIDAELEEGAFVMNPEASEMYADEIQGLMYGGMVK